MDNSSNSNILKNKQTICIFVSSTFIDMEAERDIINNLILNQLRADFSEFNVDIHFIDLRWGINTIDVENTNKRNEKILKVCMSEIDRCHPYFVGLLGKRYGWTPDDQLLLSCFLKDEIDHCKQFFSTKKLSVTALETYHALIKKDFHPDRCFICNREDHVYSDIPEELTSTYLDLNGEDDLKSFREKLLYYFEEKEKSDHLISYGGSWEGDKFKPEAKFFDSLYKNLHEAIKKDLQQELSFRNEIERENYYQDLYVQRSFNDTIIREKEIENIKQILNNEGKKGIIVQAPSGQGKSTFMSQLYMQLAEDNTHEVLFYSASADVNSSDMGNLIESLSSKIAFLLNEEYEMIQKDFTNALSLSEKQDFSNDIFRGYRGQYDNEKQSYEQQKVDKFLYYINKYKESSQKPLLILIDAFDRFDPSPLLSSMVWLKSANVAHIISTTNEDGIGTNLFSDYNLVKFPDFSREDALRFIAKNTHKKELHSTVVDAILNRKTEEGKFAYSSPLWMKLMIHVLTSLDISDFQAIGKRREEDKEQRIISHMLEIIGQTPALPGEALLYFINKSETYIGRNFSFEVLALIAFSKTGLREKDLEKLMEDKWSHLDFAILHRWIRPYLTIGSEGQWQLAHQLFINTIIQKFTAGQQFINNKLLSLCLPYPENDFLRRKMGMWFAIKANNPLTNPISYYTFSCRLSENVKTATQTLLLYLKENPDYINNIIQYVQNIWQGNFERFSAQRIIQSLGTQLYKNGLFSQVKILYHYYEPILQQNLNTIGVKDLLLPMVYDRLKNIYQNEYNQELVNFYIKKINGLNERDSENNNNYERGPRKTAMEYAEVINEIVNRSHTVDNPFVEDLFASKFNKTVWETTWIDKVLHSLGEIYASFYCPAYHPQHDSRKEKLPHTFHHYDQVFQLATPEKEILYNSPDQQFLYKIHQTVTFMEFLLNKLAPEYLEMAMKLQNDCLTLYHSICKVKKNEHYYNECALGYSLAGEFYFQMGELEQAHAAYYNSVGLISHALNFYPNSIDLRKRYLFSNHLLGRFLFNIRKFEEALEYLTIYLNGINEIYKQDRSQLTMLSSLYNALDLVGQCNFYLNNFDDALQYFHVLQNNLASTLETAPKSIRPHWAKLFFNSRYFMVRCLYGMGKVDQSYEVANMIYNELLDMGFTKDSDYEPMENICEFLGLI